MSSTSPQTNQYLDVPRFHTRLLLRWYPFVLDRSDYGYGMQITKGSLSYLSLPSAPDYGTGRNRNSGRNNEQQPQRTNNRENENGPSAMSDSCVSSVLLGEVCALWCYNVLYRYNYVCLRVSKHAWRTNFCHLERQPIQQSQIPKELWASSSKVLEQ